MKKRVFTIALIALTAAAVFITGLVLSLDSQVKRVAAAATESVSSPELISNLPEKWIDSLLRVEDPSFWSHPGVDVSTPGQGWTTITQGLVKRLFSGPLYGVVGKSRQSVLALLLNRHLDKGKQLQAYLELAYFGTHDAREIVGFRDAARSFYGKSLLDLSDTEFIGLVAMLVAPNELNPVRSAEHHHERVERIEALLGGRCAQSSWRDVMLEGCGEG